MATLAVVGVSLIWSSIYAATASTSSISSTSLHQMEGSGHKGWRGGMGPMAQMTDAEKTAFEAMSATEKQTYMEKKRTEMEAKRDAHEVVIDKLLAGTALTADEETLRKTIITERAERKVKQAEMEANRTKIQAILAKKKAGTSLTADEQTLLDSMPKMGRHGGMKGMMGGGNRQAPASNTSTSGTTAQ